MNQKFLGDAKLYSSAAWLLSKNTGRLSFQNRARLIPSHILKAFSLELYIRVLLNLTDEGGPIGETVLTNSLLEMYRSLDKTLREQMETSFSRVLIGKKLPDAWPLDDLTKNRIPRDLDGNLVLWSQLLSKFRQPNGLESAEEMPEVWFAREIEEVLRKTLSALKSTEAIEKAAS